MDTKKAVLKILIIDDDADMRDLLAERLKSMGFETSTASGGYEGLELCGKQAFDVVITDMCMEHGSGPEFIERLRAEAGDLRPVVIGMSGLMGLSAGNFPVTGADAFLPKPIDLLELAGAIVHFDSVRKQKIEALRKKSA